jgi:ubiquinone/menaquinone biosynthesis C-methylase UbiE
VGVTRVGRMARVYEPLIRPLEHLGLRRLRDRLWREVPRQGAGLEIGAGTGLNLEHHPPEAFVVVSDLSYRMLREQRRRRGRSAPMVVADAQALPFRGGAFLWVAASLVFCEVPDPGRGLAEVRRTLVGAGTLHLLEHVRPRGVLGHVATVLTAITRPLYGEHFDRDTEGEVKAAGFSIESRQEWIKGGLVMLRGRSP